MNPQLSDKFKSFYNDIDKEVDLLRRSQKSLMMNEKKLQNCKKLKEIQAKEQDRKVSEIINAAKKVTNDVKNVREKTVKKVRFNFPMQSSLPPVWDEKKLRIYMKNVISELDVLLNTEDPKEKIIVDKEKKRDTVDAKNKNFERTALLNNDSMNVSTIRSNTKKVGTNVRHGIEEKNNLCTTRVSKNIQACSPNDLKIGVNIANEKSFSERVERVLNNEKSVNVNFEKHFKMPDKKLQKLSFSPLNTTSTYGSGKLTKRDNTINYRDYSNQATKNDTKQLTKVLLPVISIRGECSVRKIYNFEILPTSKQCINDANNVKIMEITYGAECDDLKKEIDAVDKSTVEAPYVPDMTENRNMLINHNDIKNALHDYNINIDDGKTLVVSGEETRHKETRKMSRKKKRKDFKVAGHKYSHDKNNTQYEDQKSPINKKKVDSQREFDTSSSTLTDDDRKLCDILKLYGEEYRNKAIGKVSKDDNYSSHCTDERSPTNTYPTNTSSIETLKPTNQVKKSNDLKYNANNNSNNINITESFQSIYKLIEDAFQSNITETEAAENEKDSGVGEMKQVIEMSEENIKRAESLLQKYKITRDKAERNRKVSCKTTKVNEIPRKSEEGNPLNLQIDIPVDKEKSGQSNDLLAIADQKKTEVSQCLNYTAFTDDLEKKLNTSKVETSESAAQTTNDKALQTDDHFDSRTRFYFKSVYDNYSNINFDKTRDKTVREGDLPMNENIINYPVPYNSIYSNDDEIMKVANKFLKSIEKQKKRTSESSEDFSIDLSSQSIKDSSISTTITPSSDVLLQPDDNCTLSPIEKKLSSVSNYLENAFSEGEVLSLGEVRILSSSSEESSSKNYESQIKC